MKFAPLVFPVNVNGQTFRFAALTHKDLEDLIVAQTDAGTDAVRQRHIQAVLLADVLNRASDGGETTSAEEILTQMPLPVFSTLFIALMRVNKLPLDSEPHAGEASPS